MQEASPAGSRQESGERQVRDMMEARLEARLQVAWKQVGRLQVKAS